MQVMTQINKVAKVGKVYAKFEEVKAQLLLNHQVLVAKSPGGPLFSLF